MYLLRGEKKKKSESNQEIVSRHRIIIIYMVIVLVSGRDSILWTSVNFEDTDKQERCCLFFARVLFGVVFAIYTLPRNRTVDSRRISKIQPRARVGT